MPRDTISTDALTEATRDRSEFSGHGNAKGSAGYRADNEEHVENLLNGFGETIVVNAPDAGFDDIIVAASWDNIQVKEAGLIGKLVKKVTKQGVDIDLGCLYELQDGSRGCLQAFGEMFGAYDENPYMNISGDERTGDKEGDDESMHINGKKWSEVRRLIIYVYIYSGNVNWDQIRPKIQIRMPGEQPLTITPAIKKTDLPVCAIAGIENINNNIKFTNFGEYFPGHAEMDRAYGYGLTWDDGEK
ncbi:MAG: Tellurium resistance protein TerA [Micavibrio aeruginosavorus]|uniref:Tellurium resistance protein TerA n=1 Tax=Micavibrio aeruginosavorus TaxID=349221 RepID=A0A7T5R273_9BACT|nr:MAG: Tellurium resistance protein TerA [Micavibrio aeruginosavorus]